MMNEFESKPVVIQKMANPNHKGKFLIDNRKESVQLKTDSPISDKVNTVQLMVGAAHPIVGTDTVLPGNATSRGEAAHKIAKYVNLRKRESAPGVHDKASPVTANNVGNLYVRSNYTHLGAPCSLETWLELTGVGGGYVKRVRVIEGGATVMDRAMDGGGALNTALKADADLGPGAEGVHRYGALHGTEVGDRQSLTISGSDQHSADNITKVVGEGARFGWLAKKLSEGAIGNESRNVCKFTVRVPQIGSFEMDPTFHELWQSWDSVFGRSYMKDKNTAKSIVKKRLTDGWGRAVENPARGAHPLANNARCGGPVTSLLNSTGMVVAVPKAGQAAAVTLIMSRLNIKWTSI